MRAPPDILKNIMRRLLERFVNFPRRVARKLFIPQQNEEIAWLDSPDALMSWWAGFGKTHFYRGKFFVSAKQIFEALRRDAQP